MKTTEMILRILSILALVVLRGVSSQTLCLKDCHCVLTEDNLLAVQCDEPGGGKMNLTYVQDLSVQIYCTPSTTNEQLVHLAPLLSAGPVPIVALMNCPPPSLSLASQLEDMLGPNQPNITNTLLLKSPRAFKAGLTQGSFSRFNNLKALYISQNNISNLPEGVFTDVPGLTHLSLDDNTLKFLPQGIFTTLTNLTELSLTNNKIASLPMDIFSSLSSLRSLILTGNNISSLERASFKGLSKLESVSFHMNSLTSLPEDLFYDLMNLKELGIGGNSFSSLPAGLLKLSHKLERFHLQDNQVDLAELPASLFSTCPRLTEVIFSDSRMHTLPEALISHENGKNLVYVSIRGNNIKEIPEHYFRHAEILKKIDLSKNNIEMIHENLFFSLAELTELSLAENNLARLPHDFLAPLQNLESLELHKNNLSRLPSNVTLFENLKSLTLAGNPWNCDCGIKETAFLVQKLAKVIVDRREVKCVDGRLLADIDIAKDFTECR